MQLSDIIPQLSVGEEEVWNTWVENGGGSIKDLVELVNNKNNGFPFRARALAVLFAEYDDWIYFPRGDKWGDYFVARELYSLQFNPTEEELNLLACLIPFYLRKWKEERQTRYASTYARNQYHRVSALLLSLVSSELAEGVYEEMIFLDKYPHGGHDIETFKSFLKMKEVNSIYVARADVYIRAEILKEISDPDNNPQWPLLSLYASLIWSDIFINDGPHYDISLYVDQCAFLAEHVGSLHIHLWDHPAKALSVLQDADTEVYLRLRSALAERFMQIYADCYNPKAARETLRAVQMDMDDETYRLAKRKVESSARQNRRRNQRQRTKDNRKLTAFAAMSA